MLQVAAFVLGLNFILFHLVYALESIQFLSVASPVRFFYLYPGDFLYPILGGMLGGGLWRYSQKLGKRQVQWALVLANPFTWLAAPVFVVALAVLATLILTEPTLILTEPNDEGFWYALWMLAFTLFYLIWLWGFAWALSGKRRAVIYGVLSGVLLAFTPSIGYVSPLGVWGVLLGILLVVLGRPRTPPSAPGPVPRAASEAPRGR